MFLSLKYQNGKERRCRLFFTKISCTHILIGLSTYTDRVRHRHTLPVYIYMIDLDAQKNKYTLRFTHRLTTLYTQRFKLQYWLIFTDTNKLSMVKECIDYFSPATKLHKHIDRFYMYILIDFYTQMYIDTFIYTKWDRHIDEFLFTQ